MKKAIATASLLAALVAGNAHAATTYTGTRAVGTGSVALSITTDDTIGTLTAGNILDFTITLANGAVQSMLFGPLSGDNARVEIMGNAFTATATQLLFDFSAPGNGYALFIGDLDIGRPSYCLQNSNCWDQNQGEEIINAGPNFSSFTTERQSGLQVIASTSAVPEPATWAMMIAGFGLVGGMMRRRAPRVAAVLA